jgi:hypothetical protein
MADGETSSGKPVDPGDGGALGTPAEYKALRAILMRVLLARREGLPKDVAEDLAQATLLTLEKDVKSGNKVYSLDKHLLGASIVTASNMLLNVGVQWELPGPVARETEAIMPLSR